MGWKSSKSVQQGHTLRPVRGGKCAVYTDDQKVTNHPARSGFSAVRLGLSPNRSAHLCYFSLWTSLIALPNVLFAIISINDRELLANSTHLVFSSSVHISRPTTPSVQIYPRNISRSLLAWISPTLGVPVSPRHALQMYPLRSSANSDGIHNGTKRPDVDLMPASVIHSAFVSSTQVFFCYILLQRKNFLPLLIHPCFFSNI
ncbi:hypothetical protein Mapa_009188 [Marchantia paleacea]|nr:hypothetical protein Mapa_009188 [Marchantia paleacea]